MALLCIYIHYNMKASETRRNSAADIWPVSETTHHEKYTKPKWYEIVP